MPNADSFQTKSQLDLDQFDRWASQATPRPWSPDASQILGANGGRVFGMNEFVCEPYTGDPDTEHLCQAVNALPALISELRASRKVVEAAREVLIVSGFTDLVSDESYGPRAADYPSGYTVLQVCVDNYDRQSNRE